MPYTPTGRPAGRPRTSQLRTLSVKLPQDLLIDARVEARLTGTTLSDLLRDGLAWRLTQTKQHRVSRRAACAEIQYVLAHEASVEAQEAAAEAQEALATLPARRAARVQQEAEAFRAQIMATMLAATAAAPQEPSRRELGQVAAIVQVLAPTHPEGVRAADVLAWCQTQHVTWATPALVEQAVQVLRRDYPHIDGLAAD
jgi:hypothetical protein